MMTKAFIPVLMLMLQGCSRDIKFDKFGWNQQSDPAFPPDKRTFMVNDLLQNYHLKGKHYSEIIELLGGPEFGEKNEMGYFLEVDYGWDIDPVYRKSLIITIESDSTVRSVGVQEWKD